MSRRADALAQAAAADAAARRGPHWFCRVQGCQLAGRPQAAPSPEAAFKAADRHVSARHPAEVPEDLEEQRARWVAAGRPPLGEFPT